MLNTIGNTVILGVLALCFFTLAGCGGGGGGGSSSSSSGSTATAVSGKAVQGIVKGALVFADRNGNRIHDAGEEYTYTDNAGNFTLLASANGITLVSLGGTDMLTGQPALPMVAPAGSANITPLTTLVANAANPALLIAKLNALAPGSRFDIDLSGAVPADLLKIAKSAEATLRMLENNGVNDTARQMAVMAALGSQLQTTSNDISTPAGLAATFNTAVSTVAPSLVSGQFNVPIPADLGLAIGNAVQTLAIAIGTATSEQSVVAAASTANATDISASVQTIKLKVGQVVVRDAASVTLATIPGTATTFLNVPNTLDSLVVTLAAENTMGGTANFTNATLRVTVSDRTSPRQIVLDFTGISIGVTAGTAVSVTGSSAGLTVTGSNTAGSRVSATLASLTNPQFAPLNSDVTIGLSALQNALTSQVADLTTIFKTGAYDVTFEIIGAQAAPMALAPLTVI